MTKKIVWAFTLLLLGAVSLYSEQNERTLQTTSDNFKTEITITVLDQSVDVVLDALANQANVNLVQSEETKNKRVSLTLNNIPIIDALDLVIRATDLSYQILDNSILVASEKKIQREIGLNTFVFDLQYADAGKIKPVLADITKKVQIDPIGNRIIYQADPKKADEIEKVLTRLDRPQQQVLFKAKIVEVSKDDNQRFGLNWNNLNRYTTTIREGSYADWGQWEFDDEKNEWKFTYDPKGTPVRNMGGDNDGKTAFGDRPNGWESETTAGFNTIWHRVVSQEYLLDLEFSMKDGNAKVLAEPQIATLNNQEAFVHIGDRVPYTVTRVESGTTTQSIQKEEVGVKLKVKPIINEENDITVAVDTEVSSIFGWRGPNQDIPWVKVRNARTTVRVRDRKTIVIGGMLLEDESVSISKLPLLGSIPYLGVLFQHQVQTKKKTDLIIYITPIILIDGQVITEDVEDYE